MRDFGAATSDGDFVEDPVLAELLAVLASQVVPKGGGHLGPAAGLQGVEDQDARPGNEEK